jgi:hypothetical protein
MSTEPFTDEETTDIMRFLGYPDWTALSQSIQLGYPSASQPMFLAYDSMVRISPQSRAVARENLCQLKSIEGQLGTARSRMKTTRVGEVSMNANEARQLREEYVFWQRKLADLLGVFLNPHASLTGGGMQGGINARVVR